MQWCYIKLLFVAMEMINTVENYVYVFWDNTKSVVSRDASIW